jgi:hypothetical protein
VQRAVEQLLIQIKSLPADAASHSVRHLNLEELLMKKPKRPPPRIVQLTAALPVAAAFLQLLIELVKRWPG